jgi:hypothetical protein
MPENASQNVPDYRRHGIYVRRLGPQGQGSLESETVKYGLEPRETRNGE